MAMLTVNFTESELGYDKAPPSVQPTLRRTAELLEIFRNAGGGKPFYKVSGWRSVERNRDVGGVPTSQHIVGEAADFTPSVGINAFLSNIRAAHARGELPEWGQLVVYPFSTGHVHLSLPNSRHRNEILLDGVGEVDGLSALGVALVVVTLILSLRRKGA